MLLLTQISKLAGVWEVLSDSEADVASLINIDCILAQELFM